MAITTAVLVSFNYTNGANPKGSLIADANGDLFGTTANGGANGAGTVFEIAKTATGYASTPTTLVSFNGVNGDLPTGSLIADSNGDLFGTTQSGGANGFGGTVFEIAKTATGYASTPTTLVSFNNTNGATPEGSLVADANGDLFGTTANGGANGAGTVFEIAKTATGYASTPTTLVSFNDTNGSSPTGSLIADANGDLFGTTEFGGANGAGTAFEIAKTATGYASTPTTLVSFNGTNGSSPTGSLITNANGDLFGTTAIGGTNSAGTVFEVAKTATGYASTPTTLVSFTGTNGSSPTGSLITDANGDLFGTTTIGGASNYGTVFEVTGSTGSSSVPSVINLQPNQSVATPVGRATTVNVPNGGNNIITSFGSDTVNAGSGSDLVFAAGPSIVVNGGSGKLTFVGGSGNDLVHGGRGTSIVYGGTGGGDFSGGAAGNNILVAAVGNTTLRGGGNGDALFGSPSGNGNLLQAGPGSEIIVEGTGATTVQGGVGTNVAFAGTGPDTYLVNQGLGGKDLIVGFKQGADKLHLNGFDANQALANASTGDWGTTLNLSDGTQVVLFGIQNLGLGDFA